VAVNETFDLEGPAGRLEAILMTPSSAPLAAAVVCHAHPLHGGMMHFKVVFRVAKALQAAGCAVLRFNFRGVGQSEGSFDDGEGEQGDGRAALDEMERRFSGRPLLVGGLSFGSVVALRVGRHDERVRAAFLLGYPATLVAEPEDLDLAGKPRLFVQGEKDRFCSGEKLRALVEPWPDGRSLVVVPGADHLFTGQLDEAQAAVERWAKGRPWDRRGEEGDG